MRPSSTRKSRPSSAIVVPKALRSERASITAIASAFLLRRILVCSWRRLVIGAQQFFRFQAEPLNGRVDPGPFFRQEPAAFALQKQIAGASLDEHAQAPPLLDQLFVDQLLISL